VLEQRAELRVAEERRATRREHVQLMRAHFTDEVVQLARDAARRLRARREEPHARRLADPEEVLQDRARSIGFVADDLDAEHLRQQAQVGRTEEVATELLVDRDQRLPHGFLAREVVVTLRAQQPLRTQVFEHFDECDRHDAIAQEPQDLDLARRLATERATGGADDRVSQNAFERVGGNRRFGARHLDVLWSDDRTTDSGTSYDVTRSCRTHDEHTADI
jgi:hypothetical protein